MCRTVGNWNMAKIHVSLDEILKLVEGTNIIIIDENSRIVQFITWFIYLESAINYLLDNKVNTCNRVLKILQNISIFKNV